MPPTVSLRENWLWNNINTILTSINKFLRIFKSTLMERSLQITPLGEFILLEFW